MTSSLLKPSMASMLSKPLTASSTSKVDANCAEYGDILLSMDKLWKAWAELGKYKSLLKEAHKELEMSQARALELEQVAVEKHRQWEALRSSGRSRVVPMTKEARGRLDALMSEHRTAYDAAYMAERDCLALVDKQSAEVESLEDQVADLVPKAKEYERLDACLERLLEQTFDGPTPGYPDEDEAETRYLQLREECNTLEEQACDEHEACRSVEAALKYTSIAVQDLYQAHHMSVDTAYHPERDFLEQFACSSGAAIFQLARMMLQDAQELQPGIEHFKPIDVAYPWERLLAKDRHVVQRVARAWANLRKLSEQLAVVVPLSRRLRDERQMQAQQMRQDMVDARVELRRLRQSIMDDACARYENSNK